MPQQSESVSMMKGKLVGTPCQPNCCHIVSILPMKGLFSLCPHTLEGDHFVFSESLHIAEVAPVSKLDSKMNTIKMYFLSE